MMTFDELERTAYINDDKPTLNIIEVCREHFSDVTDDQRTESYDGGFEDGKAEGHDTGYEQGYAAAMHEHKIPY
jgi:hypothetical protein